jgi:glycosyltransferase involved in cell wall biosynthesis
VRVCFPYVGDTLGGSHLSSLLLATNLASRGIDSSIVLHQKGPLSDHLDAEGIEYEILELPHLLRAGGLVRPIVDCLRLQPVLSNFLRWRRIDLVHGNDGRINQTWTMATRLSGRPFIWHQRARFDGSRLRRLIAERASAVLCVSNFARDRLPSEELRVRARIVRNPFDVGISVQREAARTDLIELTGRSDSAENLRLIGFCGSLTEQKRPRLFLDIAARVAAAASVQVQFVLMGADRDGLWPALQDHANQIGIADKVSFVGFQRPAEYWLSGLDVLVATQIEDAFPRVLVEAMLVETPVVASSSGGHGEIIDEPAIGKLVPADDSAAFAAAVMELLQDADATAAMTMAAKEQATRQYSIERHVDEMAEIYRSLTNE